MTNNDDTHDVGYKRPPKQTQFRPGQSGNPAGRRRDVRNFKNDLMEELREMIIIRENGRERKISKQRAFIKALVAAAIKSDVRAINAVVACTRNFDTSVENNETAPIADPEDLDILEAFVARERKRRDPKVDTPKSKKQPMKRK
jgi:Family of unknown function (DUF5681)